jgi:hypothetical protein
MLIRKNKVIEAIISRGEAGMFEYKDSGKAIEMGEKAFIIKMENILTEEMETLYFKKRENAEIGKENVKVYS